MNDMEYIGLSIWMIKGSKPGRAFIIGLEGRLNTMMNKFGCKPDNWSIIRLSPKLRGADLYGSNVTLYESDSANE